jgi:hypothetical protein
MRSGAVRASDVMLKRDFNRDAAELDNSPVLLSI